MLLFEYCRIKVKKDLKIVSIKATIKLNQNNLLRKVIIFFIRISPAVPFVEYVIDYLVRILVAILS